MTNFQRYQLLPVIILLALLSSPASAEIETLEAEGNLQHWVLYGSSHGPCAGASWSHDVDDGPFFELQTASYDGSCVVSNWVGRSDSQGLLLSGNLSSVYEGIHGWWIYLESQISALISLTEPTLISATRNIEGILPPGQHTVTITMPDGETDILLGPDTGINSTERILNAGIYRITLSADAEGSWDDPFSYSGLVEVNWDITVDRERLSWGRVKTMYHAGQY